MTTKTPLISAIVPVYKVNETFLRACIESMLNQTEQSYEIILIDDGSPDRCGQICDEYARRDGRVMALHKKNGGVSSARNYGLKYATGHYLTFLDADDMIAQDTWTTCIKALQENDGDCAVFGWTHHETGAPVEERVAQRLQVISADEAMCMIAGHNEACGGGYPWNKMWNADRIREKNAGVLPSFDSELFTYEDKFWILQCLNGLERVVMLPQVFYDYRYVENSLTNSDESWYRRQFNAYKAYDKICDFLQPVNKAAYQAGLGKYFRFCFIDLRNMHPWRKKDMARYKKTRGCLYKVCRRIRPGDLQGFKYNLAWIVCLAASCFHR